MPITISYDLTTDANSDRNYIRSMFERFHWRRIGGSVFRYDGIEQHDASLQEDWLNHVAPALMFFRSFLIRRQIQLKFFTLDTHGTAFLDHSDAAATLGVGPQDGNALSLNAAPTNSQSGESRLREFVNAAITASGDAP